MIKFPGEYRCAQSGASVVEFETENSHMPLLSVARSSVFDELLLNHLIQGGVCTCACVGGVRVGGWVGGWVWVSVHEWVSPLHGCPVVTKL